MRAEVAILGGGVAGLCAARQLNAANVDLVVVEARDRLGGRILTADEAGGPSGDGFDLGPSWFWPNLQPDLAALVSELGLESFAQYSDGDLLFERSPRERPQRHRSFPQEQRSFRLMGGTGSLVRALARELPRERILLGAQVTTMTLGSDTVDLTIRRADTANQTLTARHVIAAMPPRLLEATVSFIPGLAGPDARRWRDTPTWMAPHAKFFALYDRPFWREAGLSGTAQSLVGPMAEIHDATTASGAAALFGFVGLDADHRAAAGEEALVRACVNQMVRIFGADASAPRATLLKDWAADPLTATAADRTAGGDLAPASEPWVTGRWSERLVLGGSETSPSEPGYLAGALVAASSAVDETLQKLRPDAQRGCSVQRPRDRGYDRGGDRDDVHPSKGEH